LKVVGQLLGVKHVRDREKPIAWTDYFRSLQHNGAKTAGAQSTAPKRMLSKLHGSGTFMTDPMMRKRPADNVGATSSTTAHFHR
jgi:hypothetical protein